MLAHRSNRFILLALAAVLSIAAYNCVKPASPNPDGGAGGGFGGSSNDGGHDMPPAAFPMSTPLLFGYALVDAFPGTFLSGAMDMEWPKGSSMPFVLQRGGHIVRLRGDGKRDVCLSFETQVALRAEAGALGMALHPKFADTVAPQPYVYVWYTADGTPTHQRLARFTWDAAKQVFDAASQLVLIDQIEGSEEHNGARIRFGPDGFLYFGNGDDLRTDDTAQKLDGGLFSGVFRIDVDQQGGAVSHPPPRQPAGATTTGYFIPNDNPFVGVPDANEEFWALGFRNPYSFNFDRATSDIWLGDVGDTWREEVDRIVKGGNYGWPFAEGKKVRRTGAPVLGTLQAPAYDYTHASLGDLAATMMGFRYRGAALPELSGKIVFSDWPTGRVWALDPDTGARASLFEGNVEDQPVGWGQDVDGELYFIAWSRISKLVRAPSPHAVPLKLSQTHLFRSLDPLEPSSSLVPYQVRSPLWSDGAAKQRFIYVPQGAAVSFGGDAGVTLPEGALLVKQFDLPDSAQPIGRTRKLETRVIVVGTASTYGITYRWNAAGTDADLVTEALDEQIADANPAESRAWHYPSSGECWACHRPENRVLGFRAWQLNWEEQGVNQLARLTAAGVLDGATLGAAEPAVVSPTDESASIDARAGAWLAANCSHCHHPGAAYLGGVTWNALPGVAPADRGLVNAEHHNYPMATALGLVTAPLVTPGNPQRSILWQRINSTDPDLRMPPVQRTRADPVGVGVISEWITSLSP